jgi:hypothetical protein
VASAAPSTALLLGASCDSGCSRPAALGDRGTATATAAEPDPDPDPDPEPEPDPEAGPEADPKCTGEPPVNTAVVDDMRWSGEALGGAVESPPSTTRGVVAFSRGSDTSALLGGDDGDSTAITCGDVAAATPRLRRRP